MFCSPVYLPVLETGDPTTGAPCRSFVFDGVAEEACGAAHPQVLLRNLPVKCMRSCARRPVDVFATLEHLVPPAVRARQLITLGISKEDATHLVVLLRDRAIDGIRFRVVLFPVDV